MKMKKSEYAKGYKASPMPAADPMFLGKPNQIQSDRSAPNPVAGSKPAGKGCELPAMGKHSPHSPVAVPKMKSVVKKTKKGMK